MNAKTVDVHVTPNEIKSFVDITPSLGLILLYQHGADQLVNRVFWSQSRKFLGTVFSI